MNTLEYISPIQVVDSVYRVFFIKVGTLSPEATSVKC